MTGSPASKHTAHTHTHTHTQARRLVDGSTRASPEVSARGSGLENMRQLLASDTSLSGLHEAHARVGGSRLGSVRNSAVGAAWQQQQLTVAVSGTPAQAENNALVPEQQQHSPSVQQLRTLLQQQQVQQQR